MQRCIRFAAEHINPHVSVADKRLAKYPPPCVTISNMIMIIGLLGGLLAFFGVFLYRKRRKKIGTLLAIAGTALVILSAIALLSFHP